MQSQPERVNSPYNSQNTAQWMPSSLIEQEAQLKPPPGLLAWWYSISTPPTQKTTAPREARELVRRARLTSIIILLATFGAIAALPVAFNGPNYPLLFILFIVFLVQFLAVPLNREGQILAAGILVTIGVDGGVIGTLFTQAGGVGILTIPLFALLIEAEFVAVSLLPPWNVFIVALINSLVVWFVVTFEPHAPVLNTVLATHRYDIIFLPITLQIIVAFGTFLWVRYARLATNRAGHAEDIATLEHIIAQREHTIAQQKQQLDKSINLILQTHTQVANGDLHARVPLTQENTLWSVAGSLNNLLARFERLKQAEISYQQNPQSFLELQQLQKELSDLIETIRAAKRTHQPLQITARHTLLNPLFQELNGIQFSQKTANQKERDRY